MDSKPSDTAAQINQNASGHFQTVGPAIAAVALLDVHAWPFAHDARGYSSAFNSADRPHLILPEVWVDDLSTAKLAAIARPMLDASWQAFDLEACGLYDAQSNWVRQ